MMSGSIRRNGTPPHTGLKSLMTNPYLITLGSLPQHLPQQIASVMSTSSTFGGSVHNSSSSICSEATPPPVEKREGGFTRSELRHPRRLDRAYGRPVQSIDANIAEESSIRYYAEVPEPCASTEEWLAGNPVGPDANH
jgi:hypothetical protein